MHGVMTSASCDAWLATLILTFESLATRSVPVTAQMRADCERHLRDNARATIAVSRLLH